MEVNNKAKENRIETIVSESETSESRQQEKQSE